MSYVLNRDNRIEYTSELYAILDSVNKYVNKKVTYKVDTELYKKSDFWVELAKGGQGDCEDYALGKRRLLLDRGLPIQAISIATCWTETNEYHAVLIVHTSKCDYLLDNRFERLIEWRHANYKWHKLQIYGAEKWKLIKN